MIGKASGPRSPDLRRWPGWSLSFRQIYEFSDLACFNKWQWKAHGKITVHAATIWCYCGLKWTSKVQLGKSPFKTQGFDTLVWWPGPDEDSRQEYRKIGAWIVISSFTSHSFQVRLAPNYASSWKVDLTLKPPNGPHGPSTCLICSTIGSWLISKGS